MNQGPSDSNSFIAQQKVEEEQTSTTKNNSKLLLQQHQVLLERHQQGSSSSSSAPLGNSHQGTGKTTNSNTTAAAAALSTGAVAAAGSAATCTDNTTTALRQKNDLLMMEKARSVIDTVLALNQLSPADNTNNGADNSTQTRTHTDGASTTFMNKDSSNIMIRNESNENEQTNVAAPTQTNNQTVGAGTSSTSTRRRSSPPSNQLLQAADQHGATTTADITSSSSGAAAIGGGPNKKLYWFTEDPSPEDFNGMTFPQKLHHVLRNDKHASVISWLPSGRSFVVRDQKKFASDIVPKYFGKHIAYTSFTRRLARWGWQNIAKGTYFNKDFNRDNPEQCLMMQYNSSTVSNRPTGGAGGNTMTTQGGGGGANMHQATCGTVAGYPSSNQNMMTMGAVVGTGGNEKRSANEMLATSSSAYGPGSSTMMGPGTMGHPHHPMVPSPKRQNSGNLGGGGGLSSGAGAGPTSNVPVPPYHTNPAAFLASFGVTATTTGGDGVNSVHQLQMPSALHSSFTHHMPTAPAGSSMTSSIGNNLPSTTSGTGAGILFPPPSELLSGVNGGVTGQAGNFNDVVGAGGRSCSSLPDITLMEQHQGLVGGGANHPLSQSGTAMPSSLMSFGVPRGGGGGNGFDPLFGVVSSGVVGTSELLSSRATDGSNSTNSRNNGTFTPSEMLQSSAGGGGETTATEQQDQGATGAGLISSTAAGAVDDSNASTSSNQALHHQSKNTINDGSGAPGPPPHHHPGTNSNSNLLDLPPSQSNADPAPSSAAAGLEHPGAPSSLFPSQYQSAAAAAALPYGGMGAMDFTKFHNYMMMDSNSSAGAGTGAGANAAAAAAAHHEFAQKQMEIDQLQQRLFAYEQLQQHQKNLFANTGAAPTAAANFMGDNFLSGATSSNYPYGNSSGTTAGMLQQQQSILNAGRQQGHLLDDITGLGNMGLHSFTGEQQGQQQEENNNGGTRHVFYHNAAA